MDDGNVNFSRTPPHPAALVKALFLKAGCENKCMVEFLSLSRTQPFAKEG